MKKLMVKEKIESLGSGYDLENSLNDLIEYLMSISRKYEEKYGNMQVSYEYMNLYDDSCEFILSGEREETNREYQKRLKRIENSKKGVKIAKANKEEKEKKLLKNLMKKYPGEVSNG